MIKFSKKNSWQKVNNFFNNHTPNVLNVLVKKYEYKVVELLGKKKNQIINIIHPGMMYKNYETFIYELVPPVLKKKKKTILNVNKYSHKQNKFTKKITYYYYYL
jgi:hypothetical protein